jgi:hypothetical protein
MSRLQNCTLITGYIIDSAFSQDIAYIFRSALAYYETQHNQQLCSMVDIFNAFSDEKSLEDRFSLVTENFHKTE